MSERSLTLLVTGGTGTLGRAFTEAAEAAGHRVRVMSRSAAPAARAGGREWARADLVSGDGLETAVTGVDVVMHGASDPRGDPRATDVEGTGRLVEAARRAGVRHLVYPSIVGIDRIPYPYYQAKLEAERRVAASGVPHTTVRITQFHSFVDAILSRVGRFLVMPLPTKARIQSIAVEEAAALLLGYAEGPAAGRAPDAGGPEILTLGEMARSWIGARRLRRWVVHAPFPGGLARAFREGHGTAPGGRVGKETWEEWLRRLS